MENVNLYQETKFSLYLSFSIHYNFMEISGFMLDLSIKIALSCFKLFIF